MPAASTVPLLLFAKEPLPGKVKTRMQPCLEPVRCAELASQMLEDSLALTLDCWPGEVILCVTPDCQAPFFRRIGERTGVALVSQVGDDLGMRMYTALRDFCSDSGAVVMGCDVPHLSGGDLAMVHDCMITGQNVIGPAADGGFYLLGLHQLNENLFSGIGWGGDTVLKDFLARCSARDIPMTMLETLRDIDECEDLAWLASVDERYEGYLD